MKYPTLFLNHGGGPLPLLGRQPNIVAHMEEAVSKWLPKEPPKSIVVVSAHWENDPIKISSSPQPSMLYDYHGFPPETYKYEYSAPGSPKLANKIQDLLAQQGLEAELDNERGFDHGVFIPLMIMYPNADIPVVCVSLHSSLSIERNWKLGSALSSLRDEGVLIIGSGYTFHNMHAFFHPSDPLRQSSNDFNNWLKEALLGQTSEIQEQKLLNWEKAPGARDSHPREEHFLPLVVIAAAASSEGSNPKTTLIWDVKASEADYAISSYMFE